MKYFGTDGIRGVAYDFLTDSLAYKVGTSLVQLDNPCVMVGRDTRESGTMLANAIIAGAQSVGLNTLDIGVVSTPMLSYLCGKLGYIGIMITASHNPYQDNGIKVFMNGKKLFLSEEGALEAVLNDEIKIDPTLNLGRPLSMIDAFQLYEKLYQPLYVPTSLKIGLDLANGATYAVGKRIFQKVTSSLSIIADQPDGKNINLGVGSTHLEAILSLVKEHRLDVGFAFDGDGDRLMAVDALGHVFDGDMLIYVIGKYLKSKNLLNENTVVLSKMCNLGIIKAFERAEISVLQTDVGDKYVLEALETKNLTLGGENSGHVINRYLLNTGDGVLNACMLVKIMTEQHASLSELTEDIQMYPDRLVNLKNIDKALVNEPTVIATVERVKNRFGRDGKVLVRASGTEPLIRVSVQAPTETQMNEAIDEIISSIRQAEKNNANKR